MSFRCTIARDFLEEMRNYARARKPSALVTANNSLNAAQVLYAQCRGYAYNIYEMSQVEDFVVVEDMSSQPRILENGRMFEYSPTYKLLHAISHGKPIVAVTIAEADYHTAPNLVRLAMAEAAANNASYLSWPTWPEEQRQRMISLIRPQADLLRKHAALLNETQPRRDVLLFLPFRKWLESDQCRASRLAAELSRANIQYEVICEDDLAPPEMAPLASGKSAVRPALALPDKLRVSRVLVSSSLSDFTPKERVVLEKFSRTGGNLITAEKPDWLQQTITRIGKLSVYVDEPPTVRVLVRDQPKRTIVHLLNLNVQRISSFEDKVTPASNVRVSVRVPFGKVRLVTALSSDSHGGSQPLQFSASRRGGESDVEITVPKLEIATILVIQ